MIERKSNGSCFWCGEKFHPLHQWAVKQLRLVILGDNKVLNKDEVVIRIEVGKDNVEETSFQLSTLGTRLMFQQAEMMETEVRGSYDNYV